MTLILPLLILVLSSTIAGAQALQVPRVEVGGEVGWLGAIAECFCTVPTFGPRLTVNISQLNAVEVSAETLAPANPGNYGLYFLQYKRTTRRSSRLTGIRPFYTAGTGGYFTYEKVREYRQTRQDGSVVVYPAHTTGELSRLLMASFGGGFERGLNRHASFRLEGSVFVVLDHDESFLAYRVLAGLSVPIGGYRADTIK